MSKILTKDISVIISTRNRELLIRDTLQIFEKLDTSGLSWEIIVIDNGSSDGTRKVLNDASCVLPLIHLYEPEPGKSRSLNKGLSMAKGRLLVFADDDIIPDSIWLKEYYAASLRWPDASIFGGNIEPKFPANTPTWITNPKFDYAKIAYAKYAPSNTEGVVESAPHGGNFAIKAKVLFDGIKFNTMHGSEKVSPMGEDTEILRRLHVRGEKYVYVPSARVEHIIPQSAVTLKWLLERASRHGKGYALLKQNYEGKQLFGVPRYLWRQAITAWIKYIINSNRDELVQWQYGKELYTTLGIIKGYRINYKDSNKCRKDVFDVENHIYHS